MNNGELIPIYASSVIFLNVSTYDIYLIIVAAGILISSILGIYNAVKSNQKPTIDNTTADSLKKIDEELKNKDKDKGDNDSNIVE